MAFGYQVLGFGSGVSGAEFMTATGGTITDDGDYKVHTFTSSGNFVVTGLGSDGTYGNKVEYLVVGSGGGGGHTHGGGGGAGGYRHKTQIPKEILVQLQEFQVQAVAMEELTLLVVMVDQAEVVHLVYLQLLLLEVLEMFQV